MNQKIFTGFMRAGSESRARLYTMKFADRLSRMIDVMPDGASIILSVEDMKGLLSENGNAIGTVEAPVEVKPPDFNWTWRVKHASVHLSLQRHLGAQRHGSMPTQREKQKTPSLIGSWTGC